MASMTSIGSQDPHYLAATNALYSSNLSSLEDSVESSFSEVDITSDKSHQVMQKLMERLQVVEAKLLETTTKLEKLERTNREKDEIFSDAEVVIQVKTPDSIQSQRRKSSGFSPKYTLKRTETIRVEDEDNHYQELCKEIDSRKNELERLDKEFQDRPLQINRQDLDLLTKITAPPKSWSDVEGIQRLVKQGTYSFSLFLIRTVEKVLHYASVFFQGFGCIFLLCSALSILIDKPIHLALSSVLVGIAGCVCIIAFAQLLKVAEYCLGRIEIYVIIKKFEVQKIENLKFWCQHKTFSEINEYINKTAFSLSTIRNNFKDIFNKQLKIGHNDRLIARLFFKCARIEFSLSEIKRHPNGEKLIQYLKV